MGFLGNMLSGGKGLAGAQNAHLAEIVLKQLTVTDRKRVAEKIVEMGVRASGGRDTPKSFAEFFNSHDRLYQLNCVALALQQLHIDPRVAGASWMPVSHPFAVPTDSSDLQTNALYFRKKLGVPVAIGVNRITLEEWLK